MSSIAYQEKSWRRVVGLAVERSGSVAIEFALLAPVLLTLTLGIVDYGALVYQDMEVAAAAHAGADYALHNGWNTSGIQAAVVGATGITVAASPAPVLSNACIVNGVVTSTAGSTCASGQKPGSYVLVSASSTVTPIVNWPAFLIPATVSAQAMVRIG